MWLCERWLSSTGEWDKRELSNQEQQSQQKIPTAQGQELENLSSIERNARSSNVSIFEFQDDVVDASSIEQRDTLQYEMRHYKSLTMSATEKKIQMFWSGGKKTKQHFLICLNLLKLTFTSQQHLSHLNIFSL